MDRSCSGSAARRALERSSPAHLPRSDGEALPARGSDTNHIARRHHLKDRSDPRQGWLKSLLELAGENILATRQRTRRRAADSLLVTRNTEKYRSTTTRAAGLLHNLDGDLSTRLPDRWMRMLISPGFCIERIVRPRRRSITGCGE